MLPSIRKTPARHAQNTRKPLFCESCTRKPGLHMHEVGERPGKLFILLYTLSILTLLCRLNPSSVEHRSRVKAPCSGSSDSRVALKHSRKHPFGSGAAEGKRAWHGCQHEGQREVQEGVRRLPAMEFHPIECHWECPQQYSCHDL